MDEIDKLFQEARAAAPTPSAALAARVLADAAAVQPRPGAIRRPGWLARFGASLGGWGVMAGLAATATAGLALGFFGPSLTSSWPTEILTGGAGTVELFPDPDDLFTTIEG
jgi:hypothetical protein